MKTTPRQRLALTIATFSLLAGLLPGATAGAASDPPASFNDTCFGKHPTIIKWAYDSNLKARALRGTPGDDVIIGTDAADYIYGNGGNDVICARGANDVVIYGSVASIVSVDLGGGNDDMWAGDGDGATEVNGVGGPGDDSFWGTNGDAYFDGGTGNNDFYGGGGWTDCWSNGGVSVAYGCHYFTNVPTVGTPPPNYVRAATTTTTSATPVTTTRPPTTTTTIR